jgi:hypothetical protein
MKFHMTRRRWMVAGAFVATLAASGVAYGYFTAGGSGTGTASVGGNSALVLHATTSGSLYPGTSTPVTFTVDNPSTGTQQLGTIHLQSIVACSTAFVSGVCATGNEITSCESIDSGTTADANTGNFYMADVPSNQTFGPGNGQAVTATGTLKMNNLSTNQNACQNAYLLLKLTS